MSEDDDPHDRDNKGRFPLSLDDKLKIEKVVELVRDQLRGMSPSDLRATASVLHALERLPAATPGIQVIFGFEQRNIDGNYGWVDIEISEDEFRLGAGEHFYDPSIGGDAETRTVFAAQAGGNWSEGDIDDWLPLANVIAAEGYVSAEDNSDHDAVEWTVRDDQGSWHTGSFDRAPSSKIENANPNPGIPSHDELQRIFDEAATLKNNHFREQLAFRHMIALADHFEGWAMDERMSPEQTARLLGHAESLRQLADLVGSEWNPPEPERLSLIGFLGRRMLDE